MRAYYINLSDRTDRRATMEAQFGRLGMAFERVEAQTPADVTEVQRARYCDRNAYRWQSEGELACSLSHVLALRRFLASGDKFGLILEDDAILSPSLPGFLAQFERLSPPLDLLRIETDNARLRLPPSPVSRLGDYGVYRLYSDGGGAAGYIVSVRAARRITTGEEILANLTDQALFSPYQRLPIDLAMRQLDPALVIQQDRVTPGADRTQDSDLETLRRRRGDSDTSRFWHRAHHNFRDFVRRDIIAALRNLWLARFHGVTKRAIAFKPD